MRMDDSDLPNHVRISANKGGNWPVHSVNPVKTDSANGLESLHFIA